MRHNKIPFYTLVILIALGLGANPAAANPLRADQDSQVEALILEPGTATSCQQDFIVENTGDQMAHLKVLIGDEEYTNDLMQSREKRYYSLNRSISISRNQGKNVTPDDVATIINKDGRGKLRLLCAE
ncbi:MAG: hypothetical protein ACE5G9_11510 [Nitrospinales bacterium]